MRAPDADAVRAALAELRGNGPCLRRLPLDARVAVLGRVLERFRDPSSAARQALEGALPAATGLAPATLRAGLDLALEDWTCAALTALVERELGRWDRGRSASGFPVTAVLLGGALPTPTLLALLTPLVLGSPVLARVSSHDPVTARCFADALAAEDAVLGAALRIESFPSADDETMAAFLSADCVVAYGSDATMGAVAGHTTPRQRLVRHGHRVSVAALGEEAQAGPSLAAAARAFALDVALWDQQGCLSPLALYLLGRESVPEALLDRLAEAFTEVAERLPRGRPDRRAAAERAAEQETARLRAAAGGRVAVRSGPGFTLVAEPEAAFRGSPLQRFVRIHAVPAPEDLLRALAPLAPRLASLGWAGPGTALDALLPELPALGVSRVCPLGRMQAPPLDWCHDQEGVLLPLARLLDVEP